MGKSLKIDNEILQKTRLHFRENMPVTKKWAYFDHAAVAPLPGSSRQAILHWLDQATEEGDTCWPQWNRQLEKLRRCGADLLHASQDEIALIPNTSSGISFVAEGLPWKAGDNLVIPNNEFPSNALPWKHLEDRGIEVRQVPLVDSAGEFDLSPMARAIDSRTRLISVSWVGFSNGMRIPLDRICELASSRKVLLFLDAIQGLGVFPLDLSNIRSILLRRMVTNGCWAPKAPAYSMCGRNTSSRFGRASLVGEVWKSLGNSHQIVGLGRKTLPSLKRDLRTWWDDRFPSQSRILAES